MIKLKKYLIFFIIVELFPFQVFAEDEIYWFKFNFPPVYILEGEHKGEGILDGITDLVTQRLSNYKHSVRRANAKRIIVDFKHGKNACTIGMIKNEQRAKVGYYSSLPTTLLSPLHFVIRKEDQKRFGSANILSLEKLIQDKSLILGLASKVSFGKELDAIIAKHKNEKHIFFRGAIAGLVQMLVKERVDYMITYQWVAKYLTRPEQREKISFIAIKEARDPIVYHAICSKTDWGQNVIKEIDRLLVQERAKEKYRTCMERWMPKDSIQDFRKLYEKEFLLDKSF